MTLLLTFSPQICSLAVDMNVFLSISTWVLPKHLGFNMSKMQRTFPPLPLSTSTPGCFHSPLSFQPLNFALPLAWNNHFHLSLHLTNFSSFRHQLMSSTKPADHPDCLPCALTAPVTSGHSSLVHPFFISSLKQAQCCGHWCFSCAPHCTWSSKQLLNKKLN